MPRGPSTPAPGSIRAQIRAAALRAAGVTAVPTDDLRAAARAAFVDAERIAHDLRRLAEAHPTDARAGLDALVPLRAWARETLARLDTAAVGWPAGPPAP